MVFAQGKEALLGGPRPNAGAWFGPTFEPQGIWSLEGTADPGLMGENGTLPPTEGLRFGTCCPSVSHEGRRVGFVDGLLVTFARRWS